MPLNIKHHIAIALGIGVIGAYFFHQSKPNLQAERTQDTAGQFKPLSSFGEIGESPKLDLSSQADSTAIVSVSDEAPVETAIPDEPEAIDLGASFAAKQAELPRPEPATDMESFELPPLVMDDEEFDFTELDSEQPESELLSESETSLDNQQVAPPSEISQTTLVSQTINQSINTGDTTGANETMASQPLAQMTQPQGQGSASRSGTAWKKNPFMSGTASGSSTPQPKALPGFQSNRFNTEQSTDVQTLGHIAEPNRAPALQVAHNTSNQVRSLNALPSMASDQSTLNERPASVLMNKSQETMQSHSPARQMQNQTYGSPDYSDMRITPISTALPESAAQQAAHHIEYGKSLSRRGASFAAKQELYSALRVIAQANDASIGGNNFSTALGRGILLMKEAEDFVVKNPQSAVALDVAKVIDSHRSNLISATEAASMSPAQAMQRYYTVAQEQLDFAGGRNVVSAEAFFCLGKLQTALMKTQTVPGPLDTAKAIVFHQVALQSDNNHFRSANELGVLLAKTGQLERSTELFKQSLIANPTTQGWQNLAKAHNRLGEQRLAQLAHSEAVVASQVQVANSSAGIQWMPAAQFVAQAPVQYEDRVATKPGDLPPSRLPPKKEDPEPKSLSERIKDLF